MEVICPSKYWLPFTRLHNIITQDTQLFITITEKFESKSKLFCDIVMNSFWTVSWLQSKNILFVSMGLFCLFLYLFLLYDRSLGCWVSMYINTELKSRILVWSRSQFSMTSPVLYYIICLVLSDWHISSSFDCIPTFTTEASSEYMSYLFLIFK